MITEDYVSFETAKLLKEKGFDEPTDKQYNVAKEVGDYNITDRSRNPERYIDAPTLQMAMKWLREVHTIIIEPHHQYRKEWYTIISSENPLGIGVYTTSTFNTYEEACEEAIQYCLENLI